MEVVLPVVANAKGNGEISARAYGVFCDARKGLLEEVDVALATLGEIEEGLRCRVGAEVGEGVGAELVGPVVEAASANVGNIDAEFDLMLAGSPGDDVGAVEVVLGAALIGLGAASCECA